MSLNRTNHSCARGFSRRGAMLLTLAVVAHTIGCESGTSGPAGLDPADMDLAGKPIRCDAGTDVLLTLRDDPEDALSSDDGTAYPAHTAANGNLMLWTDGTGRYVNVLTTAFDGTTTDRIYTNTHENPCGLDGMANDSEGSARFTVELGDGNDVIHYGQTCWGKDDQASRVSTTRSLDGSTWTITGVSGVQCRTTGKGKKAVTEQVGTAGGFNMTLAVR